MNTTAKHYLIVVIGCIFFFASLPAHGCVACTATCPDIGLCVRVKTSGYSTCAIACGCPIQNLDCFVTLAGQTAMVKPCFEAPMVARTSALRQGTTLGLTATKHLGVVTVQNILRGSPASLAGIHVGDRIVEINGKDVSKMSYQQISNALDGSDRPDLSLVFNRHGNHAYLLSPQSLTIINDRIIERRSQSASVRKPLGL